jgi:hypothetical protein
MSKSKPDGEGNTPKNATAEEAYEPGEFAKKYGMPVGEAKTIIKRYGPSRKKVDAYMAARNA